MSEHKACLDLSIDLCELDLTTDELFLTFKKRRFCKWDDWQDDVTLETECVHKILREA